VNEALTEQNVCNYLTANWAETSIAWPNQVFDDSNVPYVSVQIATASAKMPAIGGDLPNNSRDTGQLILTLMVHRNSNSTAQAQRLCQLMSNVRTNTTMTFSGRIAFVSGYARGKSHGYNIIVPYSTHGG